MITLFTGLPGNGKTLFALTYIKEKAERENRQVFYHGVNECTLPWTPFKAEEWMDLPYGSMVLIDECQFVFPRKPNGSVLPAFYEKLATHRHYGFDIFLITQHPTLIDNFVRKLTGQHFHSVRKFGLNRATIYEWSQVAPAPETAAAQKTAVPLKWAFNKEAYSWYKSAEVHTVKRAIPAKLYVAVAFVVLVLAALYWFVDRFNERRAAEEAGQSTVAQVAPVALPVAAPAGGASGPVPFDPVADAKHYVAMQTPRIEGLPHTAPKYDAITVPVRAPVPAACIQMGDVRQPDANIRCKCFSQQGTPMAVEFNMCLEIARNGYFRDFDADRDSRQSQRAENGVAVLQNRQEAGPSPTRDGPTVLAFNHVPDAPRAIAAPSVIDDGPPNPNARARHAQVPSAQ